MKRKYKWNLVTAPRLDDYRPKAQFGNSLLSAVSQRQHALNQWSNAGVERVAKQARQAERKVKEDHKVKVRVPYKVEGNVYHQVGSRISGVATKDVPRNPNNSSTSKESTDLENRMYSRLDSYRSRNGYRTEKFDIPLGNEFVKVQIGTAAPQYISVNALDTVAKYAGYTDTPMGVMYGLPQQETGWGRRTLFNFGSDNINRIHNGNKTLGNADYFSAFGSIPQEYLVRDFRYNSDATNAGQPIIDLSTPPLAHAFEYFKQGKYNPGSPTHTSDVKKAGRDMMNENTGNLNRYWYSPKGGNYWYHVGQSLRKNKKK